MAGEQVSLPTGYSVYLGQDVSDLICLASVSGAPFTGSAAIDYVPPELGGGPHGACSSSDIPCAKIGGNNVSFNSDGMAHINMIGRWLTFDYRCPYVPFTTTEDCGPNNALPSIPDRDWPAKIKATLNGVTPEVSATTNVSVLPTYLYLPDSPTQPVVVYKSGSPVEVRVRATTAPDGAGSGIPNVVLVPSAGGGSTGLVVMDTPYGNKTDADGYLTVRIYAPANAESKQYHGRVSCSVDFRAGCVDYLPSYWWFVKIEISVP